MTRRWETSIKNGTMTYLYKLSCKIDLILIRKLPVTSEKSTHGSPAYSPWCPDHVSTEVKWMISASVYSQKFHLPRIVCYFLGRSTTLNWISEQKAKKFSHLWFLSLIIQIRNNINHATAICKYCTKAWCTLEACHMLFYTHTSSWNDPDLQNTCRQTQFLEYIQSVCFMFMYTVCISKTRCWKSQSHHKSWPGITHHRYTCFFYRSLPEFLQYLKIFLVLGNPKLNTVLQCSHKNIKEQDNHFVWLVSPDLSPPLHPLQELHFQRLFTEWLRMEGTSGAHLVQCNITCAELCPDDFWVSPQRETLQSLLSSLCQILVNLVVKIVILDVQTVLCFSLWPLPITGHQ